MEHHGEDEAVERATNGEDSNSAQHANGIGSLMVIKVERAGTLLGFLALEVGPGVRDRGNALVHLFANLLHQTLPEFGFFLTSNANSANRGIHPFWQAPEHRQKVGDWAGGRDLWNEFTSVLAVCSSRIWVSIGETSCDASAVPVGKSEVVLWVSQELVQVSFRLVGDIAVVFLVEALGEHGMGELSLSTPVVCADVSSKDQRHEFHDRHIPS